MGNSQQCHPWLCSPLHCHSSSSTRPSDSNPNFTSSINSFTASKASLVSSLPNPIEVGRGAGSRTYQSLSKATEVPTLPPAPALFQALSPTPCLATSLGPAHPSTAIPVEPVCPSEPISPVTEDVPETVLHKSNDPKPPSSNARMNEYPSQPLVGESVAKEMEGKTCVLDDKSQQVVETQQSDGTTKCRPKFLGTATVVQR